MEAKNFIGLIGAIMLVCLGILVRGTETPEQSIQRLATETMSNRGVVLKSEVVINSPQEEVRQVIITSSSPIPEISWDTLARQWVRRFPWNKKVDLEIFYNGVPVGFAYQ